MRDALGKAVISLTPEEVVRVRGIVLDRDEEAALKFLSECLDKKISEVVDRPH